VGQPPALEGRDGDQPPRRQNDHPKHKPHHCRERETSNGAEPARLPSQANPRLPAAAAMTAARGLEGVGMAPRPG
jgi:hypothetical protein